jgi:hypothetical protein
VALCVVGVLLVYRLSIYVVRLWVWLEGRSRRKITR